MEERAFLRRLVLALLVAALCAVGWLWWMYLEQKAGLQSLGGELMEARALRSELTRLRELHETMRADLRGLCERLLEGGAREKPSGTPKLTGDVPLSALERLAAMLEEQNKELAAGLAAAEKRIVGFSKKLSDTQAQLNQTKVTLARTQKALETKTTQADGLQTKVSDLQKEVKTHTGESAKLREQLAAVITERGKLLAEKNTLEARVKTLTTAESEQSTTIAALTQQLDRAKEEVTSLKKKLDVAGKQIASLKQQLEALKKKQKSSAD
ncbi:MAG: hypothetical protein AMK75_05430 [Planctomycetes bacterium SM23_65]|nr:MAG: hypothetical protein AMK75_05430 [Planctomycetes bacterium SM23_65]